jgi:hypothetical protein
MMVFSEILDLRGLEPVQWGGIDGKARLEEGSGILRTPSSMRSELES